MNQFLAEILSKTGGLIHKVETKYQGQNVVFHVREITGDEATKLYEPVNTEDADVKKAEMAKLPSRIVAAMTCKEDGTPLFDESEVGATPNALLMVMRDNALRINGLGGAEPDGKDVKGKA